MFALNWSALEVVVQINNANKQNILKGNIETRQSLRGNMEIILKYAFNKTYLS